MYSSSLFGEHGATFSSQGARQQLETIREPISKLAIALPGRKTIPDKY